MVEISSTLESSVDESTHDQHDGTVAAIIDLRLVRADTEQGLGENRNPVESTTYRCHE